MEPRDVAARIDELWLLDVREDWEWEAGHIATANHIPMHELGTRLDEVPRDRTVVAVCRSGARSGQATNAMLPRGFDVHNLVGGMQAWGTAGLDVVSAAGGVGTVV